VSTGIKIHTVVDIRKHATSINPATHIQSLTHTYQQTNKHINNEQALPGVFHDKVLVVIVHGALLESVYVINLIDVLGHIYNIILLICRSDWVNS